MFQNAIHHHPCLFCQTKQKKNIPKNSFRLTKSTLKVFSHETVLSTQWKRNSLLNEFCYIQFIINYNVFFLSFIEACLGVNIKNIFNVINTEWTETFFEWKIIFFMILIRRWMKVLISNEKERGFLLQLCLLKTWNEKFIYLFLWCGYSAFSTKTTKDSVEEVGFLLNCSSFYCASLCDCSLLCLFTCNLRTFSFFGLLEKFYLRKSLVLSVIFGFLLAINMV